jgi:hypothetical protein
MHAKAGLRFAGADIPNFLLKALIFQHPCFRRAPALAAINAFGGTLERGKFDPHARGAAVV